MKIFHTTTLLEIAAIVTGGGQDQYEDGSVNICTTTTGELYFHKFVDAGTAAHSSPSVIRPTDYVTNGNKGNWIQGTVGEVFGLGTMPSGLVMRNCVGFDVSHYAGDTTNDLNFSIGACMDSTNTAVISTTTVIAKQIDANWVTETNTTPSGGNLSQDDGIASNLYLWVIMGNGVAGDGEPAFWNTADGTSLAARVAAASFSYYKVIGFRHLTSGTAWAGFTNNGPYLTNWTASESVLSSGVTDSFAVVDHTALIAEDYIEMIEYGVRDTNNSSWMYTSDDGGTNISFVIGQSDSNVTDTDLDIWGKSSVQNASLKPYSATREFRSNSDTLDLLSHALKFKR